MLTWSLTALLITASVALVVFLRLSVRVGEGESVLVLRGAQVLASFETAGLHFLPVPCLFGATIRRVSRRLDSHTLTGQCAVDGVQRSFRVWLDFQIVAPRVLVAAGAHGANAVLTIDALVSEAVRRVLSDGAAPLLARESLNRRLHDEVVGAANARGVHVQSIMLQVEVPHSASRVPPRSMRRSLAVGSVSSSTASLFARRS